MAEVFQFKIIKPKKLNQDAIRLEILNALRKEGREIKTEYEKTTATWKRKPEFEILVGLTRPPGSASVLVGTDNEIYNYLDQGTRIRWALMSQDWRSKTTPRRIGSGPGAGRVIIAGRRAMQRRGIGPRPGIKAREFSETIRKRRKKKFTQGMIGAMRRGANKAF